MAATALTSWIGVIEILCPKEIVANSTGPTLSISYIIDFLSPEDSFRNIGNPKAVYVIIKCSHPSSGLIQQTPGYMNFCRFHQCLSTMRIIPSPTPNSSSGYRYMPVTDKNTIGVATHSLSKAAAGDQFESRTGFICIINYGFLHIANSASNCLSPSIVSISCFRFSSKGTLGKLGS